MAEELVAENVIRNYENGVLYFSNTSDEDFVGFWNNEEYIFPANSRSPMIISGETPEGLRKVRMQFAKKWAEKEFFASKEYRKMVKDGGRLPPIPNEKTFEPYIQMCLNPLPIKEAKVQPGKKDKRSYSANTKPVKGNSSLNEEFKDSTPDALGEL